ncbi:MAG: hypothetical protein CSA33_04735 [Desulfobulbus propionicus]|nr:MAG: hypothetical protein CSA33_04735 [Desulfobulbus propionicus]
MNNGLHLNNKKTIDEYASLAESQISIHVHQGAGHPVSFLAVFEQQREGTQNPLPTLFDPGVA